MSDKREITLAEQIEAVEYAIVAAADLDHVQVKLRAAAALLRAVQDMRHVLNCITPYPDCPTCTRCHETYK